MGHWTDIDGGQFFCVIAAGFRSAVQLFVYCTTTTTTTTTNAQQMELMWFSGRNLLVVDAARYLTDGNCTSTHVARNNH